MPREVVNMVASTQYCRSLDINDIADTLEIEYEQEQFPGMVYRVTTPKVCLLLFRSGKAVATGARSAEDVESAFRQLHLLLFQWRCPTHAPSREENSERKWSCWFWYSIRLL